jgi:hypothetical protein
MTGNTIRIGNIARIKHDYGEEIIIANSEDVNSSKVSGLPISFSSLENIGFVSTTFSDHVEVMRDIESYLIKYNPEKKLNITIQYLGETIAEVSLKYIHELQNVFFDITGIYI